MIDTKTAVQQIKRLGAQKFYSAMTDEGRQELSDTLRHCARDDQHAKAIIEHWLTASAEMPSPSELRELAASLAPAPPAKPEACAACKGTGWVVHWYLITYRYWEDSGRLRDRRVERITAAQARALEGKIEYPRQVLTEAASRCDCPLALRLKAVEEAANNNQPPSKRRTS